MGTKGADPVPSFSGISRDTGGYRCTAAAPDAARPAGCPAGLGRC